MSEALRQDRGWRARLRGGPTRAAVVAASVLLHLALFFIGFASSGGDVASGGWEPRNWDSGAIQVALVRAGGTTSSGARPTEPLDILFRKAQADDVALTTSDHKAHPKGSLDELSREMDLEHVSELASRAGNAGERAMQAASRASEAISKGQATGGSGSGGAGADLWGQIAPCWGRVSLAASVPVTLDIALDAHGRIATPPRIVRPGNAAPEERRLVSEARAIAAVTACGPYYALKGSEGPRVYRVQFTAR